MIRGLRYKPHKVMIADLAGRNNIFALARKAVSHEQDVPLGRA